MKSLNLKGWGCLLVLMLVTGCAEPPDLMSASFENPEPGLIRNQSFEQSTRGIADWRLIQHANADSYKAHSEGGVVRITRTGKEPWGAFSQLFRTRDIDPLRGQTLVFSVDVAGEFTDEFGASTFPTEISVLVRGVSFAEGGQSRLLVEEKMELESGDKLAWRRYDVPVKLPSPSEAQFLNLEVGVIMTKGGHLYMRAPSLQVRQGK